VKYLRWREKRERKIPEVLASGKVEERKKEWREFIPF